MARRRGAVAELVRRAAATGLADAVSALAARLAVRARADLVRAARANRVACRCDGVEILKIMWVKLPPEKLVEVRRRLRRKHIIGSIWFGIFVTITLVFVDGWSGFGLRGRWFVPKEELLEQIPGAVVVGAIFGILIYKNFGMPKPRVVCPKCETVKRADDSAQCACGGHFEDIREMKWVD